MSLPWGSLVMTPTSKKLEGHIASGTFVCPCVRVSVRYAFLMHSITSARVLKFHIWIPHDKKGDMYFFSIRIMPLF